MGEVKGVMSPSCAAVLGQWGMYAVPLDHGASVQVFDEDGEYHFTVRGNIDQADLIALLRYGNHMLGVGRKVGEEHVRSSLRALIGAAAA